MLRAPDHNKDGAYRHEAKVRRSVARGETEGKAEQGGDWGLQGEKVGCVEGVAMTMAMAPAPALTPATSCLIVRLGFRSPMLNAAGKPNLLIEYI